MRRPIASRRGKVLVLTAALMTVIMGGLALSVDVGVVATAKAQLQTAADAAALAGARELITTQRLLGGLVRSADVALAQSRAIQFAASNRVLNQPAVLLPNLNNANTASADVVVGYLPRPYDPSLSLLTDAAAAPYFNAVVARASRDAAHGGAVPGFFRRALGAATGTDLRVSATAAVVGVSGFRAIDDTTHANCLPIALDKPTFDAMIHGLTTDEFTYDAASGSIRPGPDGVAESRLYPVATGHPGNWGTIKIGVSNNSTATIGAQIRHGLTPAQLAAFPQPDPTTGLLSFEGNPGISAGLKDDLESILGKPVRLPIYDPSLSGGNGNNMIYRVVAFAPVRLMKVTFRGSDKYTIVQTAAPPDDPTAVWGGLRHGPLPNQFRLVLIR